MQTWLAGLVERVELVELVELFWLVGVLPLLALVHNRNQIRLKWLVEQQSIPLLWARILSLGLHHILLLLVYLWGHNRHIFP